ncbi:interleukin-12 subunit beta [Anolis carolinensis]|uniref:Interleukin-12 subunit beta n=1 Tax=Anolis carolinensis TaxID=28377 RepID=G1KRP1_ANOCA|nr:PREDICTED: interleukin-12 subunit beta [Anolis carolinensis]|eukprot:XP_008102856.1 PREDICTED: interleukin-12 subunit beta [Anolis carolinensis]
MAILAFILITVVALSIHSEAKQEIKGNVLKVRIEWTTHSTIPPKKVLITCNTSDTFVYWEKDGIWKGNGKSLELLLKEPPDAGTYNCRSNDTHELICSQPVCVMKELPNGEIAESVLKDLKGPNDRTFFRCTANNYSGNFTCFWRSTIQDSELKFETEAWPKGTITCGEIVKDTINMNREGTEGIYSVSCKKEQNCLSTEEYKQSEMDLHVFHGGVCETHKHAFFFKDIIKPDTTECWVHQSGLLTWTPPKTWSTPYSYFGLTYQIQMVRHGREQICEVTNDALYQNGDLLACYKRECRHEKCFIRSRNRYHKSSPWSDWSAMCRNKSQRNDKSPIREDKSKIEKCRCQN